MKKRDDKKPTAEHGADAKIRRCLKCKRSFLSGWAGERICRSCKSTEAWRSGIVGTR